MDRIIELSQEWETHKAGDKVPVGKDTYDLLVKEEMGKPIDFDEEVEALTAIAKKEREQVAEAAAAAQIDDDKIKVAVGEALDRDRKNAPPPPGFDGAQDGDDPPERDQAPTSKEIGWKSTAEFWHAAGMAVRKTLSAIDQRLTPEHIAKTTGYHESGDDTLGGYLVPEDVRQELLKEQLEQSVVRASGARVIPTTRDSITIAKIDDTTHASRVFGNVLFYWINEAATITASNLTFGQLRIPIEKLAGLCYVTHELLSDAFVSVEAEVRASFAEGAAYFEDDAFINGTGAGQPKGVLKSGALITVARAGAAGVTLADIVGLYARQRYPDRATWVANQAVLPQLLQMTQNTGTSAPVVWIGTSQGATTAPPGTLLGRPLKFTEKVPTLGTESDIGFYAFTSYVIGERENIRIDRSEEAAWTTDQVGLRFILRVGGRSRVDSAFTPKAGSTLSPYVSLTDAAS